MNDKLRQIFENLIPFIILGVAIALLVGILVMFSYVVLWGVFIGFILWLGFFIKNLLFPLKSISKKKGIIIEHRDVD